MKKLTLALAALMLLSTPAQANPIRKAAHWTFHFVVLAPAVVIMSGVQRAMEVAGMAINQADDLLEGK